MKPTQIAELLANIRVTIVSFFSILMFVALGVGVFAGIFWTAPALQTAADDAYEAHSFHHFQVQYPYGLTQDDLAQLRAVEGVTDVEEGRVAYATIKQGDEVVVTKMQTLATRIDVLDVKEGTLPAKAGELALKATSAEKLGIAVGDTLTFVHDADEKSDKDGMQQLTSDTFVVTALVESAEYLAEDEQTYGFAPTGKGTIDAVVWAPASAFDDAAFSDGFPLVNIRCESLSENGTFTDGYERASADVEGRIGDLGGTLAPARYDDLHDDAQKQVLDGQVQLDEGKHKISTGEAQILNGQEQLKQAQAELDKAVADGKAKLADAYRQLKNGEGEKAKAQKKIAAAQKKIDSAQAKLDQLDGYKALAKSVAADMKAYKAKQDKDLKAGKISQKKHDANLDKNGAAQRNKLKPVAKRAGQTLPKITHDNYGAVINLITALADEVENVTVTIDGKTMTIANARKELQRGQKELASAKAAYAKKSRELEDGWAKYYAGQQELETKKADGEKKIADGKAELKEAKQQVKEGKAKIKEMEPLLEEAKAKLAALKKYEWSIAGRSYNGGAMEVSTLSGITHRLSFSMAILFVVVGLLVSYSAIGRIVREQITQIGTKKALGLRNREITASFLLYAALAVVLGSIIGLIVGVFVVEAIVGGTMAARFTLGSLPPYFDIGLALLETAIELVLVLGAAWLSCRTILKEHAVELLKGEKPPAGKTRFYEKWAMWQKLPLYTQTIVNNCMNDKRRVFSTIVGIAGCTALVVTAITLNDDVLASYDKQYQDVFNFDTIAFVDNDVEGAVDAVSSAINADGHATAVVQRQTQSIRQPDGKRAAATIIVPADDADFGNLYAISPIDGGSVDLTADGAWVSQAYAVHLGAKAGDQILVTAPDGAVYRIPIAGFFEFYLPGNQVIMGREAYEHAFEADYAPNAVLCSVGTESFDALHDKLAGIDGFDRLSYDKEDQHGAFVSFSSVSRAVVLIYLALAVLMAVVVLLNLNVMFIDEKKRELIVLMINGFSVKDAKRYIYNDTIVLTIVGIVVGLVLGAAMGTLTVGSMEPASAVFFKGIDWPAIGIATAVSVVLSTVMSLIALRRIPAFKLTDINRF